MFAAGIPLIARKTLRACATQARTPDDGAVHGAGGPGQSRRMRYADRENVAARDAARTDAKHPALARCGNGLSPEAVAHIRAVLVRHEPL